MKKKIDWHKKAKKWFFPNRWSKDWDILVKKIARGMRYEYMFKKLWGKMMDAKICPWDMCLMKCDGADNCSIIFKNCWRRFRKELEK